MTVPSTDISLRTKAITTVLKDLLKVIKVVSLYPVDNPLPQSLKRSFAERLEQQIDEQGGFVLSVERDHLEWDGATVFQDKSKEENLAGLLFGAGITELAFSPGLCVPDVYVFLDIMRHCVTSPQGSSELAARMWESNLKSIAIKTLEDVALREFDESFDVQEYIQSEMSTRNRESVFADPDSAGYSAIFEVTETNRDDSGTLPELSRSDSIQYVTLEDDSESLFDGADQSGPNLKLTEAVRAMGFADVPARPSLEMRDAGFIFNKEISLSAEEEIQIEQLKSADASWDMYESTARIIAELALQDDDLASFSETMTISEKILGEFLRQGEVRFASGLLSSLVSLRSRIPESRSPWTERLNEVVRVAGGRERVGDLITALNSAEPVNADYLRRYLDQLTWESLGNLSEMVGQLTHEDHRACVVDILAARGAEKIGLVGRSVDSDNPVVAIGAIRVLAGIGTDEAIRFLTRGIRHRDASVRTAVLESIDKLDNSAALSILRNAVGDAETRVRTAAIEGLVKRSGPETFDVMREIVFSNVFDQLSEANQRRLLSAYSILGGDRAVAHLVEMVSPTNLLGDARLKLLREAAFEALAYNRSEAGEQALIKLSASWRQDLRRQATDALRRRREIMYGKEVHDTPGH